MTEEKKKEEPKLLPQKTTVPGLPEWWNPANLQTLEKALEFARYLAGAELIPTYYQGKPGNVLAALVLCGSLGITNPISALGWISNINGKASLWGDLPLAVAQAHPDFLKIEETTEGDFPDDDFTAICRVYRRDRVSGGVQRIERRYSIADAKTAGLWGKRGREGQSTPWITNPKRMLQMRARGFTLRDGFADALAGVGIAETASDNPNDYVERQVEYRVVDEERALPAPAEEPEKPSVDVEEEELVEEKKPQAKAKAKPKPKPEPEKSPAVPIVFSTEPANSKKLPSVQAGGILYLQNAKSFKIGSKDGKTWEPTGPDDEGFLRYQFEDAITELKPEAFSKVSSDELDLHKLALLLFSLVRNGE